MRMLKSALAVLIVLFICLGYCATASSKQDDHLRLGALFTNDMVLQRDSKAPIWGSVEPGLEVTVALKGATGVPRVAKKAKATAGQDGKWMVRLGPLPAGGPYTLRVSARSEIILSNVMVGEVWVCSGQSNMQWPIKNANMGVLNADQEVAAANYPNIRLFSVPMVTSFTPKDDIQADGWKVCRPETVPTFSAVGYFFGRELHNHLKMPVGLIQSAWGGTVAEAWTSRGTLETLPDFQEALVHMDKSLSSLEETQREYETKLAEWEKALEGHDAGHKDGVPVWADPTTDTKDWSSMELPQQWESAGFPALDGFMWFRKEVDVPAAWSGKPLTLCLGAINDMDRAWFNGALVGSHEVPTGWTQPRMYPVPANVVKPGRNVVAVRVYDIGNVGGFCGEAKDMRLECPGDAASSPLSLAGTWSCKVGLDLRNIPAKPQPPLVREKNPNIPTVLYNAMIAPLIPYGIRGAIWYQGESNAGRAYQYRSLFPALIQDWRKNWNRGDFPFLFVQLANWQETKPEPADDPWAELREAQLMTLSLPTTGMAVTIDIGEAGDIHPQNKQDVGRRLALAARHVAYGEQLVYSGPIYNSMTIEGSSIRLGFDHVGGGLVAKGGELKGFAIAGEDRKFVWADARIDGNTVVVSSPHVPAPVAVRYAWAINPVCNLYNREGLPASPFRTDAWPGMTEGKK